MGVHSVKTNAGKSLNPFLMGCRDAKFRVSTHPEIYFMAFF